MKHNSWLASSWTRLTYKRVSRKQAQGPHRNTELQGNYAEQEPYGPRLAHLRDIAAADVQMLCNIFSNPIIATNEKIII